MSEENKYWMQKEFEEAYNVIHSQLGEEADDPNHAYVVLTHKQAFRLAWGVALLLEWLKLTQLTSNEFSKWAERVGPDMDEANVV